MSRAYREPTRSDFENNLDIQPEELIDYELGWQFNNKNLIFSANFYFMNYKNQLVLTGALDDVGTPVRENSGKSFRKGVEFESAYSLNKKFVFSGNLSLSKNKNIDYISNFDGQVINLGDTDISFSPELISSLNVSYTPKQNLNINLLYKYVGEQFLSNTESSVSKLDSYMTTDINIIYKFESPKYFSEVTITAMINNIFNKKYVANGYYYTYDDTWSVPGEVTTIEGTGYYPQAIRNFLFGVVLRL